MPDKRYLLKVKGTYVLKGRAFRFVVHRRISLPPPASGEDEANTGSAEPNVVSGPFPAEDIIPGEEEGEAGPPVPIGPLRGSVTPTSPPAEVLEPIVVDDDGLGTLRGSAQQAANPIVFVRNTPFGPVLFPPSDAADPSVASSGNIVLASGNTFAFLSADGGRTFIRLDPTTIFPNRDPVTGILFDGGLCCDQIIHYVPSINRFVWLMRFNVGPSGTNRMRLAVASPQDIINDVLKAWTFWDLTAASFKLGANMVYPDVSIGDNFLYLSMSVGVGPRPLGLMVVRIPLHELANRQTIHFSYTDPGKSDKALRGHVIQNPGNEVFWAGHTSNSKMRLFSWREDSARYSSRDIRINTWPNGSIFSIAPLPDQTDWLSFLRDNTPRSAIIGATRSVGPRTNNELVFAWTAARGGGFPHAHIQVVRLDRSNFSVLKQFAIWNNNMAAAYPALITNSNNEVAASLMVGGPSLFPTHAVGIIEDNQYFGSSVSDAAAPRNGDYVTVRQHFPNSKLFAAAGHGVRLADRTQSLSCNKPLRNGLPSCRHDPHYVLFGRASDIPSGVDLVPARHLCTGVFQLLVTIGNQGDTDALASTTKIQFITGTSSLLPTPPIAAGDEVVLPLIGLPACPERCGFTITSDSGMQINESNEENNRSNGECLIIP